MTLGEALRFVEPATGREVTNAQRLKDGLQTLAHNAVAALTSCGAISPAIIMELVERRPPEGVAMAVLSYVEERAACDADSSDGLDSAVRALQSVRAINTLPLDERMSLEEIAYLIGRGWEAGLDHLGVAGSNQGYWRDAASSLAQRQGRAAGGRRSSRKRIWWHEQAAGLLEVGPEPSQPLKTLYGRVAKIINETAVADGRSKDARPAITDGTVRKFAEARRREANRNRSA